MLAAGKYATARAVAGRLLRRVNLAIRENALPEYSVDLPSQLRALCYRAAWERCLETDAYDFILADQSLLQFQRDSKKLSYSFIECPLDIKPFADFAYERCGEGWQVLESDLQIEYEVYMNSEQSERSVTPIRYDYEPLLYRPGLHPAGHLHFGVRNEIRLSVRKILTPVSFVLFIIRNFYPIKWELLLAITPELKEFSDIRNNLPDVPSEFIHKWDEFEYHLK